MVIRRNEGLAPVLKRVEADREALIASYAEVVPEVLDALSGEERMRVYEVSGTFYSSRPRGH